MDTQALPVVAIIGRPNVGKSTLFNRLVGRRLALVDDRPGVTRDRRIGIAHLGDLDFQVVDTAGLEQARQSSLEGRMETQTRQAIEQADVILFVVDARGGIVPHDGHFAEHLRRSGKPVVLVANKAEGRILRTGFYDSYALGLGEPVALSAEHGEGMNDLHEALAPLLRKVSLKATVPDRNLGDDAPLSIAIIGRPNAGKSTLINTLIHENRLLTGEEAGITRDSIAIDWQWRGRPVRLHDTAGMRRKPKVRDKLERLSVGDALRAIRFAHVVILLIDIESPLDKQDIQLAGLVQREGRALVLGLNKWDLADNREALRRRLAKAVAEALPQLRGVPFVPVSALRGTGLEKLMQAVLSAERAWNKRIPTSALNRWLEGALAHHTPPAIKGRRLKLRYATQIKTRPPTIVIFCSRPQDVPAHYQRYLLNNLRETFDFSGVPIRFVLRAGANPYDKIKR